MGCHRDAQADSHPLVRYKGLTDELPQGCSDRHAPFVRYKGLTDELLKRVGLASHRT